MEIEKIKEQLIQLPETLNQLNSTLIDQEIKIQDIEEKKREIHFKVEQDIWSEKNNEEQNKDSKNKDRFKSNAQREAEKINRLGKHEEYQKLCMKEKGIKRDINISKKDIEVTKFRFWGVNSVSRIIAQTSDE